MTDAERFTAAFTECHGRLLAYVRRRVWPEYAQDITAEVFYTAWTHLDQVPANPLPWLYRTAWHAIGNHRRAMARSEQLIERLLVEASTAAPPRDPAEQVMSARLAAAALAALSESDREAVRLVCWERLTLAEAAMVLDCSEAALKVRMHRLRRRLAEVLQLDPDTQPVAGLALTSKARP